MLNNKLGLPVVVGCLNKVICRRQKIRAAVVTFLHGLQQLLKGAFFVFNTMHNFYLINAKGQDYPAPFVSYYRILCNTEFLKSLFRANIARNMVAHKSRVAKVQ